MKVSSEKYSSFRDISGNQHCIVQVLLLVSLAFVWHVETAELLNSKERQALIGHLQDVRSDRIVLTERQKLALKQEMQFQQQGFSPFSPRTDPDFERGKVLGER